MLADSLTCLLDGHIGKLSEGQAFLPTHVAVSMLEKLSPSFADTKLQANAFGIGVFGFSTGAFRVVCFKGFDCPLCEWKSFVGHSGPPFFDFLYTELGILWVTKGDAWSCWLCGKCYGKSGPIPVLRWKFGGGVYLILKRFVESRGRYVYSQERKDHPNSTEIDLLSIL